MAPVFDSRSEIAAIATAHGLRVFGGAASSAGGWRPAMVDPETGRCVWLGSTAFAGGKERWAPRMAVHQEAVYVGDGENLASFDVDSGRLCWRTRLDAALPHGGRDWLDVIRTPHGERVVVATHSGTLAVLDAFSGRTIWDDEPAAGNYRVLSGLGVLVFGSGGMAQLRDVNGDTCWERPMLDAVVAGRHIFAVGGEQGKDTALTCYDAATGRERWRVAARELEDLDGIADGDRAALFVPRPAGLIVWAVSATGPPQRGRWARLLRRSTTVPLRQGALLSSARVGAHILAVVRSGPRAYAVVFDARSGRQVAAPYSLSHAMSADVRGSPDLAVARSQRFRGGAVLHAFRSDGRLSWRRELSAAEDHFLHGRDVVVQTRRSIEVLRAADGTTRYAYAS